MVKSTHAELVNLRLEVFDRDSYTCVWPGCGHQGSTENPLQLCHLTHRGMGGSKYANRPENCVTLCAIHHDCLDGRTSLGNLRFELNEMLRSLVS